MLYIHNETSALFQAELTAFDSETISCAGELRQLYFRGLGEGKSVWEDLNLFPPLATAARGELGK
jgi:hypothetical protein